MKILYFGTVCAPGDYAYLIRTGKGSPSVAPMVLETALLGGLAACGAQVEIVSFPMSAYFPKGRLFFGGRKDSVCGYPCRWLYTCNLPVLKQLIRRAHGRHLLKRWIKENGNDGVILTYSIPPFLVKDILSCAKRRGVKTVAIVADLLRDMYVHEKNGALVTYLKKRYLATPLRLQGEYDGYIYLTEAMTDAVAPTKPHIVMETVVSGLPPCDTDARQVSPRVILYAGMLHETYGLIELLDAFEMLEERDVELWLCGDGTAAEQIRCRARRDPRIRMFGVVAREQVLRMERRATLLVDPRPTDAAFTRYSFPSKVVEYMASGTPVLMTALEGVPAAYFDYVHAVRTNCPSALAEGMARMLALSQQEREQIGARARAFLLQEKNACRQARRVMDFLREVKEGAQN